MNDKLISVSYKIFKISLICIYVVVLLISAPGHVNISEKKNENKNIPKTPKNYIKRYVDVGLAYCGCSINDFGAGVEKANIILRQYGIKAKVTEVKKLDITDSFSEKNLIFDIKHSFDKPHDIYLAWSNSDYRKGKNFAIYSLPKKRVCLIDRDINKNNIDKVVAQEILRLFAKKKSGTFQNDDKKYFEHIHEEKIKRRLSRSFMDQDYNTTKNLEKKRVVTINIALDGTSQKKAEKIIKHLQSVYGKEFNIDFVVVDYYKIKISNSWNTYGLMYEFKDMVEKKSNIYIVFTDRDWKMGDDKTTSTAGQAIPDRGFVWIETIHNEKQVKQIVVHEVAHLFGAKHIFREDAIMHPQVSNHRNILSNKTRETVLKNKFKKW